MDVLFGAISRESLAAMSLAVTKAASPISRAASLA